MGLRRKPVTIELDGKERALRYDLNALCLFEEQAKIGIREALEAWSMSSVRALLWAGLIHEDPLLTIEDVGRMDFGSLAEIMSKIMLAFSADNAAVAGNRPIAAPIAAPDASTGAKSGASDDSISVLAMANSGG